MSNVREDYLGLYFEVLMVRAKHLREAIETARTLAAESYSKTLAVNLGQLAKRLGVFSIEFKEMQGAGFIVALAENRLAICLRKGDHYYRTRFTIAHELAHIILAKSQGVSLVHANRAHSRDSDEERVVDRIAAELVLPREQLRSEVRSRLQRGWRAKLIVSDLAGKFHVSQPTLALRLLELPGIVGVFARVRLPAFDLISVRASESMQIWFGGPVRETLRQVYLEPSARNLEVFSVSGPVCLCFDNWERLAWTGALRNTELWMLGLGKL